MLDPTDWIDRAIGSDSGASALEKVRILLDDGSRVSSDERVRHFAGGILEELGRLNIFVRDELPAKAPEWFPSATIGKALAAQSPVQGNIEAHTKYLVTERGFELPIYVSVVGADGEFQAFRVVASDLGCKCELLDYVGPEAHDISDDPHYYLTYVGTNGQAYHQKIEKGKDDDVTEGEN